MLGYLLSKCDSHFHVSVLKNSSLQRESLAFLPFTPHQLEQFSLLGSGGAAFHDMQSGAHTTDDVGAAAESERERSHGCQNSSQFIVPII